MIEYLCTAWERTKRVWGALMLWWTPPQEIEITPFEAREKIHELDEINLKKHLTKVIYYYRPEKKAI